MVLSIHRVSFSRILEGQGEVIQAAFTMEIALYKCLLTQHSDGAHDAFIPSLIIRYVHMLMCAGEGSQHFSAIH